MKPPRSTYRIQLRAEFGFDAVAGIAPYLAKLGISHVYLSPHLQAAPGSTHGYDIVDPGRVNEELGGQDAFDRMVSALKASSLGIITDIVPNHMAIPGRENAWWWDVLAKGPASAYAGYFDIDWSAVAGDQEGKVLLPVLGDRYGAVLARGELKIDGDVVRYFDAEFPLAGDTTGEVHEVMERQHYRLAYWRLAAEELEYRRFFDINSLIALRSERPDVFEATHALVSQWIEAGVVDGLRIDHVDGLANPAEYLQRVRAMLGADGYLIVEKILEPGERLRPSWPVQGTTGYDALRLVDGLFIDAANEAEFTDVYMDFTQYDATWDKTVSDCKALVIDELFGSDLARLTTQLALVCERHASARDYSQRELRDVVSALLVHLEVYRTYVVPETGYVADSDVMEITTAATRAKASLDEAVAGLVDFIVDVLTLKIEGDAEAKFVRRFQQASGPVMAKGIEDTAGYRYNRLVVLNEVGGATDRFGVRPDEFHEASADALKSWPRRMVASTTHDTKRSEDFRYRLALLSEMPAQWKRAITQWSEMLAKHKRDGLDANTEYLIYQTLVGAYPIDEERLNEYLTKAVREARAHTTWQSPDQDYEAVVTQFVSGALSDAEFQKSLNDFVEPLIGLGWINSLAAVVLRMTMPGVPDLFQGSELWNLSLVDPDNRRPVDYEERAKLLDSVTDTKVAPEIDDSGAAKLFVIHKLLQLDLDLHDYVPLVSSGGREANVVAFQREDLVVVVPRLVLSLDGDWQDTVVQLPDGEWRNIFTSDVVRGRVRLAELLGKFPVAVLAR